MIANEAPRLQSAYLSILEIGGAFGHRFRALIEFLGITTPIVTDIDSVLAPLGDAVAPEDNGGDAEPGEDGMAAGSAWMGHIAGAVTSNQPSNPWPPGYSTTAALPSASHSPSTQ